MKGLAKIIIASFLPFTANAAALSTSTSAISSGELGRIMGGLVLVVVVIIFLAWLLRRLNGAGLTTSSSFKIIASMSLGAREKIMLVSAGEQFLLLGIAPGSITTLHDFGKELPAGFSAEGKPFFADFLKTALRKPQK